MEPDRRTHGRSSSALIAAARSQLRPLLARLLGRRLRLARRPLELGPAETAKAPALAHSHRRCHGHAHKLWRTRWRLSAPGLPPRSRVIAIFEEAPDRFRADADEVRLRLVEIVLRPGRELRSQSQQELTRDQLCARASELVARLGIKNDGTLRLEDLVAGETCSGLRVLASSSSDPREREWSCEMDVCGELRRLVWPKSGMNSPTQAPEDREGDRQMRARLLRAGVLDVSAAQALVTLPGAGARGPSRLALIERPEGLVIFELEGDELRSWRPAL